MNILYCSWKWGEKLKATGVIEKYRTGSTRIYKCCSGMCWNRSPTWRERISPLVPAPAQPSGEGASQFRGSRKFCRIRWLFGSDTAVLS